MTTINIDFKRTKNNDGRLSPLTQQIGESLRDDRYLNIDNVPSIKQLQIIRDWDKS